MRKDVKLGFAVGGVLLAVLIVYVSVMSKPNRVANQPGARINNVAVTTPVPAVPAAAAETRKAETPADPFASQASSNANSSTPSAPTADASKPADGGMDWNAILNHGVPAHASESTPTPGNQTATISKPAADVNAGTRVNGTIIPTFDPGASQDQVKPQQAKPENVSVGSFQPVNPPAAASTKQHIVAQGETLSSISTALFGTPKYFHAIAQANPNVDANHLKIGTKLIIPDVTATKSTPAASKTADINVGKNEYRVQQGDNLYRISIKLYGKGDRADKIYELNKSTIGPDRSKLKLNMVLKLPEAPTEKK